MIGRAVPKQADVVVVGSGPVGAAFAAEIARQWPTAHIVIVEAGPVAATPAGRHFSNLADLALADAARLAAQGPLRGVAYEGATKDELDRRANGFPDEAMRRRPGLFSLSAEPFDGTGFPGAQATRVVGGMATQWFAACPRPSAQEQVGFIPPAEIGNALTRAEQLLQVSPNPFPHAAAIEGIRATLAARFDAGRSEDRRVGMMPMALRLEAGRIVRTAVEDILGTLLDAPGAPVQLCPDTVCRRVLFEQGRATAIEYAQGEGNSGRIEAGFIVIAADSLHTPQILFASGIRPPALGHYLNEHPLIIVDPQAQSEGGIIADSGVLSSIAGVFYVPYVGDDFPFEIEVTALNPLKREPGPPPLNVHLYTHSDIQYENCVTFSSAETDWSGLPAMSFHYRLSGSDKRRLESGMLLAAEVMRELGVRSGTSPRIAPAGSSLHYQGTVRMGASDDGSSVCDRFGRVWGFTNLFVGGNGVIPTRTAANPTLTAVALALLSVDELVRTR